VEGGANAIRLDLLLDVVLDMTANNDPYLYEKFKESFREHCDRHDPEPTEYDWLKGFGRLWRDAIDAVRSQSDAGGEDSK
jgi:hypothetical protein